MFLEPHTIRKCIKNAYVKLNHSNFHLLGLDMLVDILFALMLKESSPPFSVCLLSKYPEISDRATKFPVFLSDLRIGFKIFYRVTIESEMLEQLAM